MKTIQRFALTVSTVLAIPLSFMSAGVAHAALSAAGPIGTSIPFPTYFQDATGLALQPCLGINTDGTGLADPNCIALADSTYDGINPISFPNNFPQEFFYYIADANTTTIGPAQKNVAFRIALEGSTLGALTPANLLTFLRINFRISKPEQLVPNSTYTFTHPFGSFTCTTDALGSIAGCIDANGGGNGGAQAFRVEDIAGPPISAATIITALIPATNTGVDTFLKAVSPAAPAGYIGNPNIPQTIQSGPNGASFTMNGPSVGGTGVNTVTINQWFVAGKIAAIDSVPPTINAAPIVVTKGSTNVIASTNIIDNLATTRVTVDLGSLGSALSATLNGALAVPATASGATGSGSFTIDTNANTLSFNITTSGLTGGAEVSASINGPATVGVAAPVLFSLPLGASKIGVWNYPEALEADILAGRTYVNVRTVLFANGEIRGQILPQSNLQNMVLTAGTKTDGTWGAVIPVVDRLGTFTLPLEATDGSNVTTGALTLSVVPELSAVAITPATTVMDIGTTTQLIAAGSGPDGSVIASGLTTTWSSSDSLVATVDANGLVTAVAQGTTIISASMTNGVNTVSGTAAITVSPAPITPPPPPAPAPTCQTTADTNSDGAISLIEILNYIKGWKLGTVTNLLILKGIGFWKAGIGC
ncbi:MAG: CHRD domain-containing protein [Minisyncoccia bacterium]